MVVPETLAGSPRRLLTAWVYMPKGIKTEFNTEESIKR